MCYIPMTERLSSEVISIHNENGSKVVTVEISRLSPSIHRFDALSAERARVRALAAVGVFDSVSGFYKNLRDGVFDGDINRMTNIKDITEVDTDYPPRERYIIEIDR